MTDSLNKIGLQKPDYRNKILNSKSEQFRNLVDWYKLYPKGQPQMKKK